MGIYLLLSNQNSGSPISRLKISSPFRLNVKSDFFAVSALTSAAIALYSSSADTSSSALAAFAFSRASCTAASASATAFEFASTLAAAS